jgi:hypothetical protein
MKLYTVLALVVGIAGLPAAALAQTKTGSFQVSVHVPEVCEITASEVFAGSGDGVVTGSVFESCNSQAGFQIVASHRPLERSESAIFTYANDVHALHASGWSLVANRVGAQYGVRPISLRHSSLSAPIAVSLTITTF